MYLPIPKSPRRPQMASWVGCSAQVGFYLHPEQRLQDFEALLYFGWAGEPEILQVYIDQFLQYKRHKLSPRPGRTAARFVWFLMQRGPWHDIGIHQALRADIRYFYRISLHGNGCLQVYAIPEKLEASMHPTKGLIVWEQTGRDPNQWMQEVHPPQWELQLSKALDLRL